MIYVISALFSCFPKLPPVLSAVISVVLAVVASIWIIPFGILGILTGVLGLRCWGVVPPIPPASKQRQ